jgi:hypothetical protein
MIFIYALEQIICNYQGDIDLSCSPWDVTEIDKHQVAVSMPDCSLIEIVDLVKGTVTHKFEISGQCSGIVFTNGTISV